MSTELPRRYRPPTHLSMTLPQYKQFLNPPNLTSSPLRDIPEPHDLFHIKEDLENMANEPETRAKSLQRDLYHLIENVKIHDQEQPKRAITGGKNMNVVMERIRKQEQASLASEDESPENNSLRHNISRVLSKSQLERQAALEALKKRRRRDDTDDEQVVSVHNPIAKSASPSLDENKFSNYQQELRKKKTTADPIPNGKRRQQQYPYEHQTKKQKNISMVDDDLDFVRVKPQNQVPVLNFWAAMEPYFRPLTEEDRSYLSEKPENEHKMYEIPSLGKYYLDKWAEDEKMLLDDASSRRARYPLSASDEYADAQHETAGNTLLGRLMSSLVAEGLEMDDFSANDDDDDEDDDDDDDDDDDSPMSTDDEDKVITEVEVVNTDLIIEESESGLEERLKRELQYIGLLEDDEDDDEMDWNAREDDEISAQLRRLGRELEEQMKENEFRKGRLLQVVDTQLQYDQYRQLLDVLDVQVEQSYLKRFRVQKAKKRKSGSAPKAALSEHTIQAMDKRTKCVTHFGAIFKDKNLVLPTKSIYDEDSI